MSLEALVGRTYGPVHATVSASKAAEYVAATCDDALRWATVAPPSYAAALLFMVAPSLIHDPDVGEHTRVLVHSDQLFRWHGPLAHGRDVTVTGTVAKVRGRAGLNFVTFDTSVATGNEVLVSSTSTFLMGSEAAADPGADEGEPPVDSGSVCEPIPTPLPVGSDGHIAGVAGAASRLDLVRYAGASGDFNPIHFDHDAARRAGLDGIVVHGLLMAAWMAQMACAAQPGDAPLEEMRLRFRSALRPAMVAQLGGTLTVVDDGPPSLSLALRHGDVDLVTARAVVRDVR